MQKNTVKKVCGIDYGSKMAGTTSICYYEGKTVQVRRSEKKKDADRMIVDFCKEFEPDVVAIDAPLSLPGVYQNDQSFDDYFYREVDRTLGAMSPMFLGGLTARAMKLRAGLSSISFIEVYPVYRGKQLKLDRFGYRTKEVDYQAIVKELGFLLAFEMQSSHDLDALLCLEIAQRYEAGNAESVGNSSEGFIYY